MRPCLARHIVPFLTAHRRSGCQTALLRDNWRVCLARTAYSASSCGQCAACSLAVRSCQAAHKGSLLCRGVFSYRVHDV